MDTNLHLTAHNTKFWYRLSVAAFYFIPGLVFASWASRIPDIKNMLGMNEAVLGGLLFCIPAGQIVAMAPAGWMVSKYGSRKMLILAAFLYPFALLIIGLMQTIWQLSIALFIFGLAACLCNIATNTQAVGVERLYSRSIMASFHGLWSLAGFTGGLISIPMIALGISPFYHFGFILIVSLVILLLLKSSLLPRDSTGKNNLLDGETKKKKIFSRPDHYILILGLMAFGAMVCEGTMYDWSGVYYEDVVKPSKSLVRLGYIAAMFSMTLGRFIADKLITRFGFVFILAASGLLTASGLLILTIFPFLITATIGFLLVGFGVSSIVPIAYSLAGKSQKMLPGVAIAAVSSIGFIGFLLGPPVIGFIAHALNLRWSLGLIAIIGISITLLAPKVNKKP